MSVIYEPEPRGFTSVPNAVLESKLSGSAKLLYITLLRFSWQDNECFPGQERLCGIVGISERQLRRHTHELRSAGLIATERRGLGQTMRYRLSPATADPAVQPHRPVRPGRRATQTGPTRRSPNEEDSGKEDTEEKDSVTSAVAEVVPIATTSASEDGVAARLCTLLADGIAADGTRRPNPDQLHWHAAARRLITLDGATPEQIEYVIRWATQHEFWSSVILSMPKLREHWPKMVKQLRSEHQHPKDSAAALEMSMRRKEQEIAQLQSEGR
jgi:DNA-binding transcriptional ArsR family regulator